MEAMPVTGAALSGRLRVRAAVTFGRLHVIPSLRSFMAEHPGLAIELVLDESSIDLAEKGIDVALRMGLSHSTRPARRIGESKRLVLGTPAYFAKVGEPLMPDDLIAHQAMIYDHRTGGADWTFRRGTIEASVTLKGRIRLTAAEGVREAVFAGLGLAVASEWMFAPELESGAVRPVLQDWTLPAIVLWAVFPTGWRASAKARAFADFIEVELSRRKSLDVSGPI
jgi:DNA-binding transcriptional LysR family regulator